MDAGLFTGRTVMKPEFGIDFDECEPETSKEQYSVMVDGGYLVDSSPGTMAYSYEITMLHSSV